MRNRYLVSWSTTVSRVSETSISSQNFAHRRKALLLASLLSGGDGTAGSFETSAEITSEAVCGGRWSHEPWLWLRIVLFEVGKQFSVRQVLQA